MNDENEMSNLKDLYDELWSDAKTLVQDMAGSIKLYRNSSYLLLAMNLYPIYWIYMRVFFIPIRFFNEGFLVATILELFAIVILTFFGIKLQRVYLKLKGRYAKLLKMKSELED